MSLALILIAAACGTPPVDADNAVHPLEVRVLEERRSILSGEMIVRTDAEMFFADRVEMVWVEAEIAFEGDRLRFDRKQSLPGSENQEEPAFYEKTILQPDGWTCYPLRLDDPTAGSMVVTYTEREATFTFHPRVLGLWPCDQLLMKDTELDAFVGRTDRRWTRAEDEVIDGRPVTRIEYEREDGLLARMWIDDERNHNVVRAEFQSTFQGGKVLDTMQCELQQLDDGVWFPKTITTRQTHDRRPTTAGVTVISGVKLNQPVDPIKFEIAGLDPKPGTLVTHNPYNGEPARVWNGKELVPFRSPQAE